MTEFSKGAGSTVIPCFRYRDAPAAIEWLCENFGFEQVLVVPGEDGTVAHAQLLHGNGMIMVGTVLDTDWGRHMKQADEIGGAETQSPYVVVPDPDAIYHKAKSAGAEILREIQDEDYGGRGFTCRDLEGRIWSFGSYDPWAE